MSEAPIPKSDLPLEISESNLKVLVLKTPYFPKQKLSIRFSQSLLKSMDLNITEMKDSDKITGMRFGIVYKTGVGALKHATYGTICEVNKTDIENEFTINTGKEQSVSIQARVHGVDRFKIDKVLDYAFEGLLLTCEATVMHDKWTKNDTLIVEKSESFSKLLALVIELCKLNQ